MKEISREINKIQDCIHPTAISFPHCSKAFLTANIPKLDCDITLGNLFHVKANSRQQIFFELSVLTDVIIKGK